MYCYVTVRSIIFDTVQSKLYIFITNKIEISKMYVFANDRIDLSDDLFVGTYHMGCCLARYVSELTINVCICLLTLYSTIVSSVYGRSSLFFVGDCKL